MSGAVLYLRVSTDEQERSGLSLDAQEAACRGWCEAKGVEVVEVVRDTASGGASLERRRGLLEALAKVPRRGFLVASRRDRIARDGGVSAAVGAAVAKRRAELVTLDVQTDDAFSARLLRGVLDLVAEVERELIRSRTRAALDTRRRAGLKLGGACPYGWRADAEGRLVRDEAEWRWVQWAAERYGHELRGLPRRRWTYARLAAELDRLGAPCRGGRWHPTTVARMLRREVRARLL